MKQNNAGTVQKSLYVKNNDEALIGAKSKMYTLCRIVTFFCFFWSNSNTVFIYCIKKSSCFLFTKLLIYLLHSALKM